MRVFIFQCFALLNFYCLYGQSSIVSFEDSCFKDTNGIYFGVEPIFWKNGHAGLISYFQDNVVFPSEFKEEPPSKIIIIFIVSSDGCSVPIRINNKNLKDNPILNPIEKAYINVADHLPKWIPAQCNGENVCAYAQFNLIINYR